MKTLKIENKEELIQCIVSCDICFLSAADENLNPYVLPMNFGYHDGCLYLHSAQEGEIIEVLKKNNKVCIAFNNGTKLLAQHPDVACSYRMASRSVIVRGRVFFEEDFNKKVQALDILMKNYVSNKQFKYSDPAVKNVKIWRVEIVSMTGKQFAAPHKK